MSRHNHAFTAEPASETWVDHDGGPCPFDYSTVVQVRFSDGIESDPSFAGAWSRGPQDMWSGRTSTHIEAYRLSAFYLLPAIKEERRARIAAARLAALPSRHDRIAAARRAM